LLVLSKLKTDETNASLQTKIFWNFITERLALITYTFIAYFFYSFKIVIYDTI